MGCPGLSKDGTRARSDVHTSVLHPRTPCNPHRANRRFINVTAVRAAAASRTVTPPHRPTWGYYNARHGLIIIRSADTALVSSDQKGHAHLLRCDRPVPALTSLGPGEMPPETVLPGVLRTSRPPHKLRACSEVLKRSKGRPGKSLLKRLVCTRCSQRAGIPLAAAAGCWGHPIDSRPRPLLCTATQLSRQQRMDGDGVGAAAAVEMRHEPSPSSAGLGT